MNFNKKALIGGGSLIALACAFVGPAFAQDAAAADSAQVEEVVVTGSRIQNGFQTPTPVTVATVDDLKSAAPGNLADGLNQLPVFNNSLKTTQATGGGLGGGPGQNLLNMRNLGSNRVLVLLDGQRVVATNDGGSTDLNVLPQNLVSRVDVVTGGASAAYGSDAVAGVVNFVLDTKFQGVKGELEVGRSAYNDSDSFTSSIAAGHQWLDGRARVIGSAEFVRQAGVGVNERSGRSWQDDAPGQIPNPVAGGTPAVLVVSNIRASTGSYGGLISSGPLKGTQFLEGGKSAPFTYGAVTGSNFMGGGDAMAGIPANGLSPDQKRSTFFAHGEFDVTPNTYVWIEGNYGRAHSKIYGAQNFGTGAAAQFTIFADNAYLPADIRTRMLTAGPGGTAVASIPLGRYYGDGEVDPYTNESVVTLRRGAGGVKGSIFDTWKWDASYAFGQSDQKLAKNHIPNLRNYFAASDAVRAPTGQIVCRSSFYTPAGVYVPGGTGFDVGCVPLNPFGPGSVTKEAVNYAFGDSYKNLRLEQQVLAANLSGDFGDKLQLGAGPISLAVGGEYRKETANQTSDAVSQQVVTLAGLRTGVAPTSIAGRLGPYQFFNPQPLKGAYNVKEYYGELGVPVLKDKPFFQSLDVSLAARRAVYSQSGGVTTWKYGFNWQVNSDVRLRYTKSRDIRGPSILELFNSQSQTNQTIIYQGKTTQNVNLTSGNAGLRPEEATTETYGIVYRPSWFPGFQASVDRYKIGIADSIGSFTAQQTADQCAAGNPAACAQIEPQLNGTLIIRLRPLNLSIEENDGYDFEAAYNTQAFGGNIQLRALASHITAAYKTAPGSPSVPTLGESNTPDWRGTLSAQYKRDAWTVYLSETFIDKSVVDATKKQGVDTNDNNLPAMAYTNLTLRYRFDQFGGGQEAFVSVQNIFNTEPPVPGGNPTSYSVPASRAYDWTGRYFTVGLRWALQ